MRINRSLSLNWRKIEYFLQKNEVISSEEIELIICITQQLITKLTSVSQKEKFS